MKDILIVTAITSNQHRDICNTISTNTKTDELETKRILETTWLLSGKRSFAESIEIVDKLKGNGLPVAVFEIESVLDDPN